MARNDQEALIASIAFALNAAEIPCVLWGHCLLQVHGVPTITGSVDFVVPDDLLPAASQVLSDLAQASSSLAPCTCPSECPTTAPTRPTPPPSFHAHMHDLSASVGLYLQRDTFWFLAPLDSMRDCLFAPTTESLSFASSPFLLASDDTVLPPWRPGRADGHFKPGQPPVVVLKAHVLLEAYMRIYARDAGTTIGTFACAMIGYMQMYVDDDGLLDVDQLPDSLRTLYTELQESHVPLRVWIQKLKDTIAQENA